MIHAFSMHGVNLALDVNSGAVHVLDDVGFQVLQCYSQEGKPVHEKLEKLKEILPEQVILEAMDEIQTLIGEGSLFSADPYEDYLPQWSKKTVVKALCLHVCHDCNLRCE
ncbi:MAG TPA: thioether cross-link-forming SCIFF peptide maturase, partial [Thermoclostridium caenicola]|nr:thioether cross-link-forming SCIFF peptide maturase [Thermoclostridium caenicola]